MTPVRQLAAIMFTDIAGYTALMGKDEDQALSLLNINRKIQKPLIEKHHGKWLKELGDGVLAEFNSAYDAVKCAIEIQKTAWKDLSAKLRIGIHLGDVTNDENDVFGDGVNVASRIQGIADPGGIYITGNVENAIRNRADIQTKYLGVAELKNVDYPVQVFAIQGEGFPAPAFKPKPKPKKETKIILGFALVVLLGVATWFVLRNKSATEENSIQSLVVLPIANLTGSDDQEYIVEGIHDALIGELSQINSLRVISRTSAMRYQKSDKSIPQIGEELRVDAAVECSIVRSDDSIRLNVQIIRIHPQEDHIWAGFFHQNTSQVLGMISGITKEIAKRIQIVLSPEEESLIAGKEKIVPELYKLYLRGKYHLEKYNPADFQIGVQLLNKVIEKDPTNALAYATLSLGYGDLAHLPSAPQEAFPRAKALAKKALDLDPTLVEANTAMAEVSLYYDWHFKTSDNYFRKALAIDSNFAPAVAHYGWQMDLLGNKVEAEQNLRKAAELDPLAPIYRTWLAWWYWSEKRYDEGISEVKRVLEVSPDFSIAQAVLGGLYGEVGKKDEAIALSAKAVQADPGLAWLSGVTYIKVGNPDRASLMVKEMEKTPFNAFSLAVLNADLGYKKEAIKWGKIVVNEVRHVFTPWLTTIKSGEFHKLINDDPDLTEIFQPIIDSIQSAKHVRNP